MTYKPNTGGRPVGLRNLVQRKFLEDAVEAWKRDGEMALTVMAREDPSGFVKVFAALLPREVALEIDRPLRELTDEQLQAALDHWRANAIDVTATPVPEVKAIVAKKESDDE
jgi:hypothetical protein